MKISFIHRWIFTAIILVSATLPIEITGTSTLPIYQTENIATSSTTTKVVRYQKAKQLVTHNPFLNFHFNNYLLQDNSDINNQFKFTTQQNIPFPITFQFSKIITTKNTDNLNEILS